VPITEARRYGFAEYRDLRNERHTYVRSIQGPWLLYDNERDPYQMRNLCGRAGSSEIRAAMDREQDRRTLRVAYWNVHFAIVAQPGTLHIFLGGQKVVFQVAQRPEYSAASSSVVRSY
jgi:hypothetical protein